MVDGEFLTIVQSCAGEQPLTTPFHLEPELGLQLNHSEGRTSAQDAGRWLVEKLDLAEGLVRTAVVRQAEVGMVEEIEKLQANTKFTALPAGELRIFHHAEVCVEIARPAQAVPALRKLHRGAIAHA